MSHKVRLESVTLSFPTLFTPKSIMGSDPKYSAAFLLARESAAHKAATAAIKEVATEKWGPKANAYLVSLRADNKLCLHDGDTKPDLAGYAGKLYLNATTPARPRVVARDGQTPIAEHDNVLYAGCVVDAVIDMYAQDNQFGKRVNAVLLGVRFVQDGERLGLQAVLTDEDFPPLPDDGAASDAPFEADGEDILL